MKMRISYLLLMNMGFCPGKAIKNSAAQVFYVSVKRAFFDERFNGAKGPMGVAMGIKLYLNFFPGNSHAPGG